ncbi:hypothetical protein [Endozoicomonas sp.]|uniref:hypothetical protein n=1 Tax=Endozoicomonas sp. TaxID=1892382 RepID=UPI0028859D33|nr:hypothetical protein [Endozoicomonas sp.]
MRIIGSSESVKYQNNDNSEFSSRRGEAEETSEFSSSSQSVKGSAIKAGETKVYRNKDVYICKYLIFGDKECLDEFDNQFQLAQHQIKAHNIKQNFMMFNSHLDAGKSDAVKVSENNGKFSVGGREQNVSRNYTYEMPSGLVIGMSGFSTSGRSMQGTGKLLEYLLVERTVGVEKMNLTKLVEDMPQEAGSSERQNEHEPPQSIYAREPENLEAVLGERTVDLTELGEDILQETGSSEMQDEYEPPHSIPAPEESENLEAVHPELVFNTQDKYRNDVNNPYPYYGFLNRNKYPVSK